MVAIILSALMIITTLTGAVVRGPLAGLLFAVRAVLGIASFVNTLSFSTTQLVYKIRIANAQKIPQEPL